MEVSYDIEWDKLPEYRLAALRSILPASPEKALRAQYDGYTEEVGVPHSCVETFVSTELASSDTRWKGVPLVLTTGKALDKKCTEIHIHFRRACATQTDYLTFRIQPHEGIEMTLNTKKPGYDNQLEERHLAFSYPEDVSLPDAYEQVIVDAIRSRKSLFTSSAEVIRAWEILQPLVDAWGMDTKGIIHRYRKGDSAETVQANNV